MHTEDLTVVETRGTLEQRAEQFGEAVRTNHRATAALFDRYRPLLETAQGKRVLANVRRHYHVAFAGVVHFMRAFARGLSLDHDEVLDLNILVCLAKSRLDGCSGVIIRKAGRTVVGQNWDTTEDAAPMAILEIGRDPEGPDTVRFSSPLTLDFWSGVNPWGVAVGGCSGPAGDAIGAGDGITGTLWRLPVFYASRTVGDVQARVRNVRIPGKGFNGVYVDSAGGMSWTQQGGGRGAAVSVGTPFCVATGYRPALPEPATAKYVAGVARWRRLTALAEEATRGTGDPVEPMKVLLADHTVVGGHPDSAPCRHGGRENSTQFSVITDVTGRTVHYCGRPCENAWRRLVLS